MGYDGSVNIDTKLDTKGFNKGTKSISSSLSGVMKSIALVGKAMAAAFIGGSIISAIRSVIGSFDLMNSSIGGSLKTLSTSFAALKSSFASLVLTAFAPMIPYIITAVNWLTKLFTTLAQVTAALFGVQVAMAGLKDETAGTGKEAKKAAGALAGFDQLNVLSQQDPGTGAGGLLPSSLVPTELLDKVQAFKEKMLTFLQPVIDALGRLKDALLPLGMTIWEGLKWAWENILVPLGTWVITDVLPAFLDLLAAGADVLNAALKAIAPAWQVFWDEFLLPLAQWTGGKIIEFLEWLTKKLGELAVWISDNPQKFRDFVAIVAILAGVFELAQLVIAAFAITISFTVLAVIALFALLGVAIYLLITHWEELSTTVKQIFFIIGYYIAQAVDFIKGKFADLVQGIKGFFSNIGTWFKDNVASPIQGVFGGALNWIAEKFRSVFEGIRGFVKGIINDMIGFINGMIGGIADGINGIVDAFNTVGNVLPGFTPISGVSAPQVPYLATGAVIPPNSQFMAVLGDQRNGRNIEAPEGLIRQIVSEEIGKITADITVNFAGSLSGLVRELKPYIDKENVRVGGSLIKSGVNV